jgi:hypothetical protein
MLTKLHLTEDALALHLLLQRAESLVDVVVTNHYLHGINHHLSFRVSVVVVPEGAI